MFVIRKKNREIQIIACISAAKKSVHFSVFLAYGTMFVIRTRLQIPKNVVYLVQTSADQEVRRCYVHISL